MKICSIDGCENKHEAKGYCKRHYKSYNKYGDPLVVEKKRAIPYEDTHKIVERIEYKLCSGCNEWHPMNEEWFYKNKNSKDGLTSWCKDCMRKKSLAYREMNKDEVNKKNYLYFLEHKDRIYFLRNQWMKENEDHMKDYQKEYRQTNKEKVKYYNIKHSNKKHKISKKEWDACKKYFNHMCAYCGINENDAKEQQGQYFHKEHFVNNGAGDLSNCVPSCRSCNSQKWEFTFEEWFIKENPIYNEERKNKIYEWINGDYKQFIKS